MKSLTALLLFLPVLIFSIDDGSVGLPKGSQSYIPWFTGPYLAPTSVNLDPGQISLQPTLTAFDTYGFYNPHWKVKKIPTIKSISALLDFQIGFTDYLGLEVDASVIANFQKGQSATHLQDTWVLFGYQISNDTPNTWVPDCRLLLLEIFPTGKYQNLNPKKAAIDFTGQGSFQTGVTIAFQKQFTLPEHFFVFHWSLQYIFFQTEASVKGLNAWGGSSDTKGKVRPGQTIIAIVSGEYSLSQRWALACDLQYSYQKKTHFSGKTGTAPNGSKAAVLARTSSQFSLAPAIEYSFSLTQGLLGGAWFTVAGKNIPAFASLFISYVCEF